MGKRCFVDIHVIQTVPPSCVNRDDTGSPKTASYGGCIRARVSSQAWKRAVRQEFIRSGMEIGIRTMPSRIVGMLTEEISSRSPKGDPGLMAKRAMKLAGFDIEVPDEEEAGKDKESLPRKQRQEPARKKKIRRKKTKRKRSSSSAGPRSSRSQILRSLGASPQRTTRTPLSKIQGQTWSSLAGWWHQAGM